MCKIHLRGGLLLPFGGVFFSNGRVREKNIGMQFTFEYANPVRNGSLPKCCWFLCSAHIQPRPTPGSSRPRPWCLVCWNISGVTVVATAALMRCLNCCRSLIRSPESIFALSFILTNKRYQKPAQTSTLASLLVPNSLNLSKRVRLGSVRKTLGSRAKPVPARPVASHSFPFLQ